MPDPKQVEQPRESSKSRRQRRRKEDTMLTASKPLVRVFVLLRDGVLLDVYDDPRHALNAADLIRSANPALWRATAQPGRWIGGMTASILEVKEYPLK